MHDIQIKDFDLENKRQSEQTRVTENTVQVKFAFIYELCKSGPPLDITDMKRSICKHDTYI